MKIFVYTSETKGMRMIGRRGKSNYVPLFFLFDGGNERNVLSK